MADILRVSAPLVNKNQMPVHNRNTTDPMLPFQLADLGKVAKLHDDKQLQQQNNTLLAQSDTASILSGMLNDPQAAVQFIRAMYLLQEVVGMLPVANDPVTAELEQLFAKLMIKPDQIVDELLKQEFSSTLFRGEVFDMLRSMLQEARKSLAQPLPANEKPIEMGALRLSIGTFMKAINNLLIQEDVQSSILHNLIYLKDAFAAQKSISDPLMQIIDKFAALESEGELPVLKQQMFAVLKQIESSILLNPKVSKNTSILVYNLSRLNPSETFLKSSLELLQAYLPVQEDKDALQAALKHYLVQMQSVLQDEVPKEMNLAEALKAFSETHKDMSMAEMLQSFRASTESQVASSSIESKQSQVMHTLTAIIEKQLESTQMQMSGAKLERVVQSLLATPSHFTPLLHFVLPMQFHDLRAFAEMWIDPNYRQEEKEENEDSPKAAAHVLMAMDVDHFGRFEVEAKLLKDTLSIFLYCPKEFSGALDSMRGEIQTILYRSVYKTGEVVVTDLDHPRTLMEVFEKLPSRRTGIHVII